MGELKTKLGIFIDWYLPAYKAGGPIQSISNLVNQFKNEFDISIITSNSDLNEILNLDTEILNRWVQKAGYKVMYLDNRHQNKDFYKKLFEENPFDVVYFNSLFSLKFTVLPLWLLRNNPVRKVLATRGMLGKGALAIKPLKKKIFLSIFKLTKIHKKVIWHATAKSEALEIKKHFGTDRTIILAPNLSAIRNDNYSVKKKITGKISIVFLSRIAIKKNLLGALDILSNIHGDYKIAFSIIGPIDDKAYWEKCEKKIRILPENITVNYLGAIPNDKLSDYLVNEHLLFLPTYGENFGHVIMESWQNACPVIISDQTPWRELKKDMLGHDISLDDTKAFVQCIEEFCEMSEEKYGIWSKSSYDFAKRFNENPEVLNQNKKLFVKV